MFVFAASHLVTASRTACDRDSPSLRLRRSRALSVGCRICTIISGSRPVAGLPGSRFTVDFRCYHFVCVC